MQKTIVDLSETKSLFQDYCKKNNIEYLEVKFNVFLTYLKIDIYDWVKENLRQFNINNIETIKQKPKSH